MSDEERDNRNGNDLPREGDLLRWAEKTQRTINFMLQQQAQYQAQFEARQERIQAESQARHERLDATVQRLANVTLQRFENVEGEVSNLDRKMEALVDAQIRSEDEMKELREAQKNTDERLNAFISTVERLINERRNGGGSKSGVLDE
jgi:chromosome segregation ATPase